jgi:hypothetical protein
VASVWAYSSRTASYRVPGGGDLPVGVAGGEQSGELVLRVAVEPFVGHDQQLAC